MTTYTERYSTNKYFAVKTEYNGYKYDSKFEASVAADLDWRLKAGEIKEWERQYKVEMWAYNCHGERVFKKTHKIDFRIHEHDGSFTLLEAKGVETADYRDRRKWLTKLWLPEHLDHVYEVVKQGKRFNFKRKNTNK